MCSENESLKFWSKRLKTSQIMRSLLRQSSGKQVPKLNLVQKGNNFDRVQRESKKVMFPQLSKSVMLTLGTGHQQRGSRPPMIPPPRGCPSLK